MGELSREWSVAVERIVETPSSLVAFGVRGDASVVLKVVSGPHEEWNSGDVLAAFAGRGMVPVLAHVPGAALLPRLCPGTPLSDVVNLRGDDESLDVIVQVVSTLFSTSPDTAGFPTALDWAAGFGRYLAGDRGALSRELVIEGYRAYLELSDTQTRPRLLHGDLQHYNILLDAELGWLAIDPKGVVAERAFELGAALRNPYTIPALLTREALMRRATYLSRKLELDPHRVLSWAFAQSVLCAVWLAEDEGVVPADAPILEVASAARSLVS